MSSEQALFEQHSALALSIARLSAHRYHLSYHDRQNLENVALLGLWQTVQKYRTHERLVSYIIKNVNWSIFKEFKNIGMEKKHQDRFVSGMTLESEYVNGTEKRFAELVELIDDDLQRAVVIMRFKENAGVNEIMSRLGISRSKVLTLTKRVKRELRSKLNGQ